jgi:acetyl-CoA carboxylase biotin carboxyl carrier protein
MSKEISNEDVREFVHLAVESGVAEIEVVRGDHRVLIRRLLGGQMMVQHVQPPAVPATEYIAAAQPAVPQTQPPQAAAPSSTDVIVKSPIVGTYYEQASPGDPPFVKVGDLVEPGQVLCIIESMKLMNEIESEVAGVIVAKLMENGRPVEYGEALFTIRPRV